MCMDKSLCRQVQETPYIEGTLEPRLRLGLKQTSCVGYHWYAI